MGGGSPATEQPIATSEQGSPAGEGGRPAARKERKLRCVLLVPCCEAVHGRFPLNGTYFQTNEVFLDAATLQCPLMASPSENILQMLDLQCPLDMTPVVLPTSYKARLHV